MSAATVLDGRKRPFFLCSDDPFSVIQIGLLSGTCGHSSMPGEVYQQGRNQPFAFHKNHHLFRLAKFKYRNRHRDADDLEYSISLDRRCLDRAVTCNNSDLPDASGARHHISDPYQTPSPFERLVTFGRSIIAPALGRSGVADSPAIFYEFRLHGRHGARARQSIATESF